MKTFSLLIFCVAFLASGVHAQSGELNPKSVVYPKECGYRQREMVVLLRAAKPNRPLVIVSHLGKLDRAAIGPRRIFNAVTYLTSPQFEERWNPKFVIAAEGQKSTDLGYVDFFLDGELALRIVLENNADLALGECGGGENPCDNSFEKQFFPCKATSVSRRSSRRVGGRVKRERGVF